MNFDVKIPRSAYPYILLQRTKLQAWGGFLNKKDTRSTNFKLLNVESFFRRKGIKRAFVGAIKNDFDSISEHLPMNDNKVKIADIGCGVGLINLFISRYYKHNCEMILVDKSEVSSEIYYHFEKQGAFYNSLELSKHMLKLNDIEENSITLIDVDKMNPEEKVDDNSLDIITSFLSWGFHYPVKTYLPFVKAKLKTTGCLILDVRSDSDGLSLLKASFGSVKEISSSSKSHRVICRQ